MQSASEAGYFVSHEHIDFGPTFDLMAPPSIYWPRLRSNGDACDLMATGVISFIAVLTIPTPDAIQNGPHLRSQRDHRKRLTDHLNAGIQASLVDDRIPRMMSARGTGFSATRRPPGYRGNFETGSMDRKPYALRKHEAELKQLGVQQLYLFGSTARGEARADSDVDLFFDHERGKLGLFQLMDVKETTPRSLGRKTDIMTRGSLHPVLRGRIEASALQVF